MAFTKEKISYKSNKIYSYDIKCINIKSVFDSGKQPDDYPLNAQYCRLNDPNITELIVKEPDLNDSSSNEPSNKTTNESLRNLEES